MERRLISAKLRGDLEVPVLGWITNVPGLLITPCVTTHRVLETYCITHEHSGQRICPHEFTSVDIAVMFVEQHHVRNFAHWNSSYGNLKKELASEGTGIKVARLTEFAEEFEEEIVQNPNTLFRRKGEDVRL